MAIDAATTLARAGVHRKSAAPDTREGTSCVSKVCRLDSCVGLEGADTSEAGVVGRDANAASARLASVPEDGGSTVPSTPGMASKREIRSIEMRARFGAIG